MKAAVQLFALVAFTSAASIANAQFVKGNEAVKSSANGIKQVETPPLPATGPIRSNKPCAAVEKCYGGAWLMVETNDGLVECTEAYARPGSCRRSTYGQTKLLRVWVVNSKGKWLQCQRPDISSKCVDMFARPPGNLPFPAVQ